MKKILFLLLLSVAMYGQVPADATPLENIQITNNIQDNTATKVTVQDDDGVQNWLPMANLPVSTATTNALDLKTTLSAGAFSGFAVTNNGDGTISVGSGIAYLRATNDQYAPLIKYPIAAYNNIPLVDNLNNYIVVSYNGGSPALVLNTTGTGIDTQTNSIAIAAARVGTTVHYVSLVGSNSDPNAKLRNRYLQSEGIRRVAGLAISATGRKIATTAGITYSGLIRLDVAAMNTNVSDTYTLAYNNGSTWTRVTGQTDINNTQYNNAGTLTALNNNNFRTDYIYALVNSPSKLFVILGNTQYNTIGAARLAPTPSSLPVELEQLGVLVGRAIIEKDAVTMEMASPFVQDFAAGAIENHNDLAGLQGGTAGEYNHLTDAQVVLVDGSEQTANKVTSLASPNNSTYPTSLAVKNEVNTLKDYTREISVGAGGTYSTLELLFANEPAGKTLINLTDSQYTCLNPQFLVKTGWIIKGKGYGKTNITFNFTTAINPDLSGLQIRNDCELVDFKVTSINDTNLGGFSQYALHADYAGAFKAKITRCWFKTAANPNVVDANGYNGLAVGIGTWEGQVLEFHQSILEGQSVAIDNKYTLNLHNTYVTSTHLLPSRVSFYNCQLSGGFTTVLISDNYSNDTDPNSTRVKDLFEFVGSEIKGGIWLRSATQGGTINKKNGLDFNFSGSSVDEFLNTSEIVDTSLPNYTINSIPVTKDVDFQKNLGASAIVEGDFVCYVYGLRTPEYHIVGETNTVIGIEKLNTTNIKNFAGMSLTNTAVGDFAHINTGVISYTALAYPTINIGDLVAFNSDDASLVKSFLNGIGKVYKKTNTGRLGIFISKGGKTENSIGTYTERGVLEIKGNSGGAGHPSIWLEDSNIVGESTNYAISAATNTHDAPFYEKGRFSINDNIAEEERFAIDYRGLNIIRRKLSVLDFDNVGDNLEYTKLPTINVKGNNRPIGTEPLDFGNIQVNSREPQAEDTGGSIGLGGVYNSAGGIVSFAKIHGKKETSVTGSFDGYLAFEVSNNTTSPYTREVGRFSSNGNLSILGTATASPATVDTELATLGQAKAVLNNATLTGTPTAPTAATGTNTTQIATMAAVQANKGSDYRVSISGNNFMWDNIRGGTTTGYITFDWQESALQGIPSGFVFNGSNTQKAYVRMINASSDGDFRIGETFDYDGNRYVYEYKKSTTTSPGWRATNNLKLGTSTATLFTSGQYRLSALNTAPASATDTGTTGEIRVTATHIYVCTAANTWVRTALSSW